MRISVGFSIVWLGFTSACGSGAPERASDTVAEGAEFDAASCPNPRLKADDEGPLVERFEGTFAETLVSSADEESFRGLTCGVENSARQPTFEWTAPYSGTFRFSCVVDAYPGRDIAVAVLSGDCTGEELFCRASHTARLSFELELAAAEQVSFLIELDDTFRDDDAELQVGILDTADP